MRRIAFGLLASTSLIAGGGVHTAFVWGWLIAIALFAAPFPAMAQNSFPAPGNATVPGIVVMCYTAGVAKPCTGTVTAGSDETFTTPGGQTVGGRVRMCIVNNLAVPC